MLKAYVDYPEKEEEKEIVKKIYEIENIKISKIL
jgi:hypothetical protein